MILWFMDRLGLPGQYHRTWVRLLRDNYIPTDEVRVVQLHKLLAPRTLLTTLGSRKAPTWVPAEEERITSTIDGAIAHTKARLVVLSSPESLACLGLAPEHATLHNLRGSVYWRSGIPHLVMLPMSAWFSMVTQKEIGGANYGFESKETFTAARSGNREVSEQGGDSTSSGRNNGVRTTQEGSRAGQNAPNGTSAGVGVRETVHDRQADSGSASRHVHRSPAGITGSTTRGGRHSPIEGTSAGILAAEANAKATASPAPVLVAGNLGRWGHLLGPVRDQRESDVVGREGTTLGSLDDHLQNADDYRHGDSAYAGDGPEVVDDGGLQPDREGDESEGDSSGTGDHDSDESDASEDGMPSDGDDVDGGGSEGSSDSDSETAVDREEGEMDEFFYEPVLSPVGRFVLTADTQKMFRLLRDGKNAAGPGRPIEVNWR